MTTGNWDAFGRLTPIYEAETVAARSMSDRQREQPETLWYGDRCTSVDGVQPGPFEAPYLRMDIALKAIEEWRDAAAQLGLARIQEVPAATTGSEVHPALQPDAALRERLLVEVLRAPGAPLSIQEVEDRVRAFERLVLGRGPVSQPCVVTADEVRRSISAALYLRNSPLTSSEQIVDFVLDALVSAGKLRRAE